MKRISLLLLLLTGASGLQAQQMPYTIRVVAERQNKNVVFRVTDKTYLGTVTILLTLSDLENSNATMGTKAYVARYGGETLLTLRPADDTNDIGYGYTYRWVAGLINPKVDTTLVCRMPCSPLKEVRTIGGANVLDLYSKGSERAERLSTHYMMEKGDTVYAMRRGVVTRIEQPGKPAPRSPGVRFSTEAVSVTVEHPDGSFARYVCLDDGLFIGEGDSVLPDTPLSLAGSYDGEEYQVAVAFYWQQANPDVRKREDEPCVNRPFFPPCATTDGVLIPQHAERYTPVLTREIVTREMTKKELKKRDGNKK